ncbi:MAG TPA: hypothetical protein VHS97_20770 [Isosphaeraceae bacterium]|nr:hypothetical protein [Isosphaeraceae bacterium]
MPARTLSSFVVSASGAATAGTGFNVVLTALDNFGNTLTSFGGTVTLTSSDGQPVHLLGAPVFSNGTALVTVTLDTADTLSLTAAAGVINGTSAGIRVQPAAASAFVVGAPSSAAAGTGFGVALTAKDAYGNTVSGFSGNVSFTSSDSQTAPVVARTAFSNGTAIFAVVLNTPDTVQLTAASGTISGTSGSIIVGSASAAGDWFSQNLSDPGLRALARTDFNRDGSLTYSDMLGLFA